MSRHVIGVISDTHGLLRPGALQALEGVEAIIHAGDIGDPDILDQLAAVAPVTAVRGNTDHGGWAMKVPYTQVLEVGEVSLYVIHILDHLDLDPASAGMAAVVYGHTHQPDSEVRDGVLYLNPGSAGPRRFRLPISLARLTLEDGQFEVEFIDLPE